MNKFSGDIDIIDMDRCTGASSVSVKFSQQLFLSSSKCDGEAMVQAIGGRLLKTLILLLISVSVFAGDGDKSDGEKFINRQKLYGAGGAIINLVRSPYIYGRELFRILGNKDYKYYSAENFSHESLVDRSCYPWAEDSENLCSCKELCPDSLEIMSITSAQTIPSVDNSFIFRNHTDRQMRFDWRDLYRVPNTNGYCWGHATLSQHFSRLAIFKNICDLRSDQFCELAKKPKGSSNYNRFRRRWRRFYKKIVRDIFNNKARIVPGFNNMREFSENPEIRKILLEFVMKSWRRNSITLNSWKLTSKHKTPNSQGLKLVKQLVRRLTSYQTPVIIVGKGVQQSHAKVVWKIKVDEETKGMVAVDGSITFCMRDNNLEPQINHDCSSVKSFIKIGAPKKMRENLDKSRIKYLPGQVDAGTIGELSVIDPGSLNIPKHENRDVVSGVRSMVKLCRKLKCNR